MRGKQRSKAMVLGILAALLLVVMAAAEAGATNYTWDGKQNSYWGNANNWNPGSIPNNYDDQATINKSKNNSVQLTGTINLGGLTIGSNAGATALSISGTLGMRGNISNAKTIDISGMLRNDSGTITNYTISGGGSLSLQGGTIGTLSGGGWIFNQNVTGWGTIAAPVVNNAMVTFAQNSTISGAFTNQGTVSAAAGTTVSLSAGYTSNIAGTGNQTFHHLTVLSTGYLKGGDDTFIVGGNFLNYSTQNTQWDTGSATLAFTSGAHQMALAGVDKGQVPYGQFNPGYTDNFAWRTLSIAAGGSLSLVDGNSGNSSTALYVGVISGLVFDGSGRITNISGNVNIYYDPVLNPSLNYQTYAFSSGTGSLLSAVLPVPLPDSVWLLGSGLVGLLLLGRRRRRRL